MRWPRSSRSCAAGQRVMRRAASARYCGEYAIDPDHLDLRQSQDAAYALASSIGVFVSPLEIALRTLVAIEKPAE